MDRVPEAARKYLRIPFADMGRDQSGVDCLGLIRLVLLQEFAIAMPAHRELYKSAFDIGHNHRILCRQRDGWPAITYDGRRAGDVVLARRRGMNCHVGILLSRCVILHIEGPAGVHAQDFPGRFWPPTRVAGLYCHPELAEVSHDPSDFEQSHLAAVG